MFSSIKDALGSLKGKSAEYTIAAFLNQKIQGFGEVKKLQISLSDKTAQIELELKGEREQVWVRVNSFDLTKENGKDWIIVKSVTASREWIGLALERYVVGRRFEIPASAAWVLSQ